MIAGMTEITDVMSAPATVDQLRTQANAIAEANPPLRVLDTVILGICFALGWVFGILWRYPVSYIAFMALTIRHGYRKANPPKAEENTPPEQRSVYAAGNTIAYSEP